MFIIIGTRGRTTELSSGQFYCPTCDATRPYKRKRAATYFTLFFIPLFRIRDHGEFVECQACGQSFQPQVLQQRAPSPADRLLAPTKADLESGTPIEMVRQKLANSGVDQGTANTVLDRIIGGRQMVCRHCELSYHPRVGQCASCGATLTHPTR